MKTRKILSLSLSLVLMVSILGSFSVLAAPNYTVGNTVSFDAESQITTYCPNYTPDITTVKYDLLSGKFGRDTTDKSIYIHSTIDPVLKTVIGSGYNGKWINNGCVNIEPSWTAINPGNSIKLSFYTAFDGAKIKKAVTPRVISNGVSKKTSTDLWSYEADGTMKVWGDTITFNGQQKRFLDNRWYKIDVITTAGTTDGVTPHSYKFYIDNELIKSTNFTLKDDTSTVLNSFQGFYNLSIGFDINTGTRWQATDSNYYYFPYPTGMYLDDVKVDYYFNGQTATNSPSYKLENAEWDYDKYISQFAGLEVNLEKNVSIADFTGKITTSDADNVATINVRDTSGNILTSGIMDNKYVEVVTKTGQKYYSYVENGYTSINKSNIPTKLAAGTVIANWGFQQYVPQHQLTYLDSLSGKAASDNSMAIVTTAFDGTSANATPFLNGLMSTQAKVVNEPIMYEMNILADGDIKSLEFQAFYGLDYNQQWTVPMFIFDNTTGTIKDKNSSAIGSFAKNQWNHIVVCTYPGKAYADIYVNGVCISKKEPIGSVRQPQSQRIKIVANYPTTSGSYNGMLAVDDINYYAGPFVNNCTAQAITSNSTSSVVVDNQNKAISVRSFETVGNFLSKLSSTYTVKVYSDNTLKTALSNSDVITDNSILTVSGGHVDYYKLTKKDIGTISYTTNGKVSTKNQFIAGDLKATLTMNFETEYTSPKLIIAQYDKETKQLKNLHISDSTLHNGKLETTVNITETTGIIVKIFALDSLTGLIPLSKSLELEGKEMLINAPLTVYLASDSICMTYNPADAPQQGWGAYIANYFKASDVTVVNKAVGGKSTKTFVSEGNWAALIKDVKAGDYVMLSMGHNDRNESRPDAYSTIDEYKTNLKWYIDQVQAKNASIILITPISDAYGKNGSNYNALLERSTAMKEVAAEKDVTLLDVNAVTFEDFQALGLAKTRTEYFLDYTTMQTKYGLTVQQLQAHPNSALNQGNSDYTHVTTAGADYIAQTISRLLKNSIDPLQLLLKN